ncbi:MAG: hypothetical protein C0447_09670 [Methylobacterium sp.]|nr:hypothetical protein [Methylobacterium sp.]
MDKKAYLTTDRAGYFVAGQRIPSRVDKDGNRTPKVGHRLMLSDAEAKYELQNGVIEPEDEAGGSAPLAPGKASKLVEKPAGGNA